MEHDDSGTLKPGQERFDWRGLEHTEFRGEAADGSERLVDEAARLRAIPVIQVPPDPMAILEHVFGLADGGDPKRGEIGPRRIPVDR